MAAKLQASLVMRSLVFATALLSLAAYQPDQNCGLAGIKELVKLPTPAPDQSYAPDPQRLDAWVAAHAPEARPAAAFIAKHIIHIGHAELQVRIGQVIDKMVETLDLHRARRINLVLIAPPRKSERWISHMALKQLVAHFPELADRIAIIDADAGDDVSQLDNALIFDDGIFTGSNLGVNVTRLVAKGFRGALSVGVVGATKGGEDYLEKKEYLNGPDTSSLAIEVFKSMKIPSGQDFIDDLERRGDPASLKLREEILRYFFISQSSGLLYFDHKIPGPGPSSMINSLGGSVLNGDVAPAVGGGETIVSINRAGHEPEPPYREFRFP